MLACFQIAFFVFFRHIYLHIISDLVVDQDFWFPNKRINFFHRACFTAASWSVAFSVKFPMKDLRNVSHPRVGLFQDRAIRGSDRKLCASVQQHRFGSEMQVVWFACARSQDEACLGHMLPAESGKQQRNLIPVTLCIVIHSSHCGSLNFQLLVKRAYLELTLTVFFKGCQETAFSCCLLVFAAIECVLLPSAVRILTLHPETTFTLSVCAMQV